MSEYEIVQNLFNGIQSVMTVFSLFVTIVSGYLGALYLFLNRAPHLLRLVAFGLLSISFAFLGGTAAVVQEIQVGPFAAHEKLASPAIDLTRLRNPISFELASQLPFRQQQLGVAIGWSVATATYLALFYLTFVYRWPQQPQASK